MLKILIILLFSFQANATLYIGKTQEKALVKVIAELCDFKKDNVYVDYKESCMLYYANCLVNNKEGTLNVRVEWCLKERLSMQHYWKSN